MASTLTKLLAASMLLTAAIAQEPVPDQDTSIAAEKNATVLLFASASAQGCPASDALLSLSVAPETCVSGDFPLLNNARIQEAPVCANGEVPVLFMYPNRRCTGRATFYTNRNRKGSDMPTSSCLPRPPQSNQYWSFILRCGFRGPLWEGGDAYMDVPQVGLVTDGTTGVARSGKIETWLGFSCTGTKMGSHKYPVTLRPDQCMTAPHYAMKILEPAVCANGTRARWARFPGRRCNMGEVMNGTGLVDIDDRDIGDCQTIHVSNPEGPGLAQEFGSMSFWCDGWGDKDPWPEKKKEDEKKETTKAKKGSVSDNSCWTKDGPTRASTWMNADADTCWGLRPHAQMYLYSNARCENGTDALLAYYPRKWCEGPPEKLMEIKDDMMRKCLPEADYASDGSYAFWCTGENKGSYNGRPRKPEQDRSGSNVALVMGLVVGFMVLLVLGAISCCFYAIIRRAVVAAWNGIKALLVKQDGAIRLE